MSKAHETVRAAGVKAFLDGKPRHAPYADRLGGSRGNIVTGARGYIRAWEAGWDSAAHMACLHPSVVRVQPNIQGQPNRP